MADWRMTGVYFRSCHGDPGCPCDFTSPPTHHHCEGVLGMQVETGHFGTVALAGVRWAVAYHWPGPLHEGNGTVKPYFDPSTTPEQLDALGQIRTGQAGGRWFAVVATIVSEVKRPAVVPLASDVSGQRGRSKIGEVIEHRFGPIQNPVTGAEVAIRVRIPGGMEYADRGEAAVLRSEARRSSDEIGFDHTGCHTSFVEHQTCGSHR